MRQWLLTCITEAGTQRISLTGDSPAQALTEGIGLALALSGEGTDHHGAWLSLWQGEGQQVGGERMPEEMYLLEMRNPETRESYPLLLAAEELTATLTDFIQDHHYSGMGDEVAYLGRYEGGGILTEMDFSCAYQTREMEDWLDWEFHIFPKDHEHQGRVCSCNPLAFTVRIDGRA
jgi:hypothetical protein